jgi:hypothetical protein
LILFGFVMAEGWSPRNGRLAPPLFFVHISERFVMIIGVWWLILRG